MPYPRAATLPSLLPEALAEPIRHAIAGAVVTLFNDRSRGEKPVSRRPDGLFGPRAVAWRVHGDVTSMMVGGVAGLLLQMLHPAVLAGVWDHSAFRTDMRGRLRRTARFIALTTYGGPGEAEAAIGRVRRIHDRVRGTLAGWNALRRQRSRAAVLGARDGNHELPRSLAPLRRARHVGSRPEPVFRGDGAGRGDARGRSDPTQQIRCPAFVGNDAAAAPL